MQSDKAFADTGTAEECLDHLLGLIRRGELLAHIKTRDGALCVAACLSKIIAAVFEKLTDHDHSPDNVFTAESFSGGCIEVAKGFGCELPATGPLSDAMLAALLNALLDALTKMLQDWLDNRK